MVSRVPCGDQIHTTRKVASLEYTKDQTQSHERAPVLSESKAYDDRSPEQADGGKENSRPDLPAKDCCWWLEQDIRDEERQSDQAELMLAFSVNTFTTHTYSDSQR